MILPFEYWPSLSWMTQLLQATEVQLEQWGTYQKQSFANRCKITGNNGLITLSIPLVGGREQKTLLREVRIDNLQRWSIQHLRAIRSCYGKAPFFDHYFPMIEALLSQRYERLIEVDDTIIKNIRSWLKLNQTLAHTHKFVPDTANAHNQKTDFTSYPQVFSDKHTFIPNLSVLDGLFCMGPFVVEYLQLQATPFT